MWDVACRSAVVALLLSLCCRRSAAVSLLLSLCCCLFAVVSLLWSLCCGLSAGSLLPKLSKVRPGVDFAILRVAKVPVNMSLLEARSETK
jgi:hypothetical protein